MAIPHIGRIYRATVEGSSMAPALLPGDRLLVLALMVPRVGEIVAVPDPRSPDRLLIKRVISIDPEERTVSIEGDNRAVSTDSRTFGPVAWADVLGRAIYRYFPPSRVGRLPRGRHPGEGTVGGEP